MIKNFIKIAFRNLFGNKGFSLITILGLSVGMATAILIFLFVKHELSYDKFNKDPDRIYRIITEEKNENNRVLNIELSMVKYAPEIKKLPEIESACRLFKAWGNEFVYANNKIRAKQIFYSDSDIFNVFSFNVLVGNVNGVFNTKNTAVITKSLAEKTFNNVNAINKIIKINNVEYNISAIIDDVPENSHYKFDLLLSLKSLPWLLKQPSNEVYTYFRIKKNAAINNALLNVKKVCESILKTREQSGYFANIKLQPLLDIHLYSFNTFYKIAGQGKIYSIYILASLALFILLIAILNFANIFTANSQTRIKEIGIRKVLGSNKNKIAFQFLSESVLISFLSAVFTYLIVLMFMNKFFVLMERNILLKQSDYFLILIICFVIAFIVGIISGLYPSIYISKLSPQKILTKNISFGRKNKLMVGTVLIQFTIVITLISLMFVFTKQIDYMKNKDLGFNNNGIMVFDYYNSRNFLELKHQLLQNTNIKSVTASHSVPGMRRSGQKGSVVGGNSNTGISFFENRVQDDFIKTYGIKIIRGRDFSKDLNDNDKLILNEKAVKEFGFTLDNAVGSQIDYLDKPQTIIGVIKDYHYSSMRTAVEPLVLSHYSKSVFMVSVKLDKRNMRETINYIEEKLSEFSPNLTFDYFFIDESFNKMYKKEESQNVLFKSSVLITIVLALLGLFALTSLITFKRTKEVGIRKVFGASVTEIITTLLKDVIKYIVLSNFIAWPIAYLIINKWLQNFAYRINLSVWPFITSAVLVLFIALLTISLQVYKVAVSNPVDSLKTE